VIFLSDEFDDDYNEFLKRFKKFLNIDSDIFDVDFLFLPEPNFDPNNNLNDEDVKGFKVTYHFESGMDKPEIRIEGNFDENKLKDYFKRLNITNFPQFKKLGQSGKKQAIDIGTLSLQPNIERKKSMVKEFYHEINVHEDFIDILIEAPGVEKGHIILSLSEDARTLKVSIEINYENTEKVIQLPFEATMKNHLLEVNNGIVSIIMRKNTT
jgi:HSP20 family molecular chaperone IbpA